MPKSASFALSLAVLITPAGCSTGIANTPALSSEGSSAQATSAALLPAQEDVSTLGQSQLVFVGQQGDHNTLVVNANNGKPKSSISGQIGDIATDNEGNLYIGGVPDQGDVSIFAPPYRKRRILKVSTSELVGAVAVDPKTDILVAVTLSNPESGPPEAVFYQHNQGTPCNTVVLSDLSQGGYYAAFDANQRVFMVVGLPEGVGVASVSGECSASGDVQYSFKNPPRLETAVVAVDGDDNVVVVWSNGKDETILTYQNPNGNQFASPIATTTLNQVNGLSPAFLGLSSDGKYLWAGTCCDVPTQFLGLYKYPGGKSPVKKFIGIKDSDWGAIFPQLIP